MSKISKIILLLVFMAGFTCAKAQNNKNKHPTRGLSINAQALVLKITDKYLAPHQNPVYELGNSRIYGRNIIFNYFFNPWVELGVGIGKETLSQPKFDYYPLFVNIIPLPKDIKEGFSAFLNFGTHLGDLEKNGFLFRAGLNYYLPIIKDVSAYIGFIYTFQNIYKYFPGSERIGVNYNVEGFGFGIGLEFL